MGGCATKPQVRAWNLIDRAPAAGSVQKLRAPVRRAGARGARAGQKAERPRAWKRGQAPGAPCAQPAPQGQGCWPRRALACRWLACGVHAAATPDGARASRAAQGVRARGAAHRERGPPVPAQLCQRGVGRGHHLQRGRGLRAPGAGPAGHRPPAAQPRVRRALLPGAAPARWPSRPSRHSTAADVCMHCCAPAVGQPGARRATCILSEAPQPGKSVLPWRAGHGQGAAAGSWPGLRAGGSRASRGWDWEPLAVLAPCLPACRAHRQPQG